MGLPARMPADAIPTREAAAEQFRAVRTLTDQLAAPLSAEDQMVQSMADASPTKWHRAHTTWFFETFLLAPYLPGWEPVDPHYAYLFNSYYESVGPRHARPRRGMLSRPAAEDVAEYRAAVDAAMQRLIADTSADKWAAVEPLLLLGLNHEQQHQELILTDIRHGLFQNPMRPAYRADLPAATLRPAPPPAWCEYEGGIVEIGFAGAGFAFDCEGPRHEAVLRPFRLASRPVTNREYLEFVEDGGYQDHRHWLWLGRAAVADGDWAAPLYWLQGDSGWNEFGLGGVRTLDLDAPVSNVSFFEADAYARWADKRLPTEAEWEHAAASLPVEGNLLQSGLMRPAGASQARPQAPAQMFGDVWEWTQSPFVPYPGFRAAHGAVGEYNGKFMAGQMVLRGGSCATPPGHVRATYRNFFLPADRWQFSGFRLAEDA